MYICVCVSIYIYIIFVENRTFYKMIWRNLVTQTADEEEKGHWEDMLCMPEKPIEECTHAYKAKVKQSRYRPVQS